MEKKVLVNSKSFIFGSEFTFISLKRTKSDPNMKPLLFLFTESSLYKRDVEKVLPAIPGIKFENPPLLFFANSDFNFS